jgi:hypothetical protein
MVAALLLGGCSSKSVKDDTSSSAVSMQVSASPTAISPSATAVVEATLTANDNPVANQSVTFAVEPTSAGYCTPATAVTNDNGVAATVFTPYGSGSALITASSQFNDGSVARSVGLEVSSSQQGAQGNVTISLAQSLLLANGQDSTQVSITVRDAVGQRVPDSTLLVLTCGEKFIDNDSDGFYSKDVDYLHDANNNGEWDAMGQIPQYAVTSGGDGTAQVTYYAGQSAGTAYLKVTVADDDIGGQADKPIQLRADANINSIYLASDSLNLVVKGAGGIEIATMRATGYDKNGNKVPEGIPISFIITDGPGGGEHLDIEGYGPYTAMTNSQGTATVPLHSGTISGTVRLRAYADTILSNATQVMISAGPPEYVVVAAEHCNVDYWDNVASSNEIVAVVSDMYLNPVNDSTVVYFYTDEGTMKSHEERTKDLEGIATSVWFAGNNVETADGRVWIYAETKGGNVVDSSMFYNTHYPDTLICTGVPTTMPADGKSKTYVWITGLDLNDNPVIGGTVIKGEGNYLDVADAVLENGCYAATDRVKVTSSTLEMDYSVTGTDDDGIGATDVIAWWHGAGAISTFSVTLTTGNAYAGSSSLEKQGNPGGGETGYFTVTIKDRFGNPLADHTLNVMTPGAAASPSTIETNSYGEANFSWVIPGAEGDYTIVVEDTDPRGNIFLSTTISVSAD